MPEMLQKPGSQPQTSSKYDIGVPVKKFYFYEIVNKNQEIFSANKKQVVALNRTFDLELAILNTPINLTIDSSETKNLSSDYKMISGKQLQLLNDDKIPFEEGKVYLLTEGPVDASRINLPSGNPDRQVIYIINSRLDASQEYDELSANPNISKLKTYSTFQAFDIFTQKNNIKSLSWNFIDVTKNQKQINYFQNKNIVINDITLEFNPETLLNKLYALAEDQVDLELSPGQQALLPMLVWPIELSNKSFFKFPWLDLNLSLPTEKILNFVTAKPLLTNIFDGNSPEDRDAQYVLEAALIVSTLLPNMDNIPRTDQGTPHPDYFIESITSSDNATRKHIFAAALNPENKSQHVTAIIESWFIKYPTWTSNPKQTKIGKTLRATVCALSNSLQSDYSIAGGINDFHKAFLPWYFTLVTQLSIKTDNSSKISLTDIITVKSNSEYFDFTDDQGNNLNYQKPKINITNKISELVSLNRLNHELVLPIVEQTIQEVNVSTIPTDISGENIDVLKYLCLLPITGSQNIKKLFSDANTTIPKGTKITVSNQTHGGNTDYLFATRRKYPISPAEAGGLVLALNGAKKNAAAPSSASWILTTASIFETTYKDGFLTSNLKNAEDIKITNSGTLVKTSQTPSKYWELTPTQGLLTRIYDPTGFGTDGDWLYLDSYNYANTWMGKILFNPDKAKLYLEDKEWIRKQIAWFYHIRPEDVNVNSISSFTIPINNSNETGYGVDWSINKYVRSGIAYEYKTTKRTQTIGYDKPSVFDEIQWLNLLYNILKIPPTPIKLTFKPKFGSTSKIKELYFHHLSGDEVNINITFNEVTTPQITSTISDSIELNCKKDNTNGITIWKA